MLFRSGDSIALTAGDPGLAVQAASAIEGRFTPVRIRGDLHQDADLHLPLPVRLARSRFGRWRDPSRRPCPLNRLPARPVRK